ncbi:MAG: DNRLRE domain-containing protein [Promethearchaeota archaeon]
MILYNKNQLTYSTGYVRLIFFLIIVIGSEIFAQNPYQRMVQKFETPELGIPNPAGLAFSPAADALLVTPSSGTADLIIVTFTRDIADSVTVATTIVEPVNMAFDGNFNSLLFFDASLEELVEIEAGENGRPKPSPGNITRFNAQPFNVKKAQGMTFDPATGDLFFLVVPAPPAVPRIVHIIPDPRVRFNNPVVSNIVLNSLQGSQLRGIAFNPNDGHLYIMSPTEQKLYEVNENGEVQTTRDLSSFELGNVQNMAFAPSGDQTDDLAIMNLYIADSGLSSQQGTGDITELSITQPDQLDFSAITAPGSLVQTILTSEWSPPSPDPAGAAYNTATGRLLISDSEVNEIPALFTGVNVFDATLLGGLSGTFTTTSFSNEPTGVARNPANGHLFFSDDNQKKVFELDPGPDGEYGTPDDLPATEVVTTSGFGAGDPEGIAYDTWQGNLFIVDGVNAEIYEVTTAGVLLNQFDTSILGLQDPEGVEFNPDNGNLYIVSNASADGIIVETTRSGSVVSVIDIAFLNAKLPSGLAYGPSSNNPAEISLYMTARGVDNNTDPNENDGKIYEISLGPSTPTLSINDIAVVEGDAGTTADAVFTVTLAPTSSQTVTVDYATSDGTATASSGDYVALTTQTLTFLPGETSKTVTVVVNGDGDEEGDESFFVNLSNASSEAAMGDSQGVGTIVGDDGPLPVTVSFQDGINGFSGTRDTKLKANSPTTNFGSATTVELDGSPDESGLLYWDVSSIPVGSTVQSVDITVNITNSAGATYEIYDLKRAWVEDEATWNISASGQRWEVPGANGASDRGSTAFGAITGQVGSATFSLNAAGVAAVQSWVNDPSSNHGFIFQDYINHTNGLDFSSREAATVADRPELEVTYINSGQPLLSIDDVTVLEGASGMTVDAVFTVTLSPSSSESVTVDYATSDGMATAGSGDYVALAPQMLTFLPGETSKTVTVVVNGDDVVEADETYFVDLSNAVNATIGDGQGMGTIGDDDTQPSLQVTRGPYLQLGTPTSVIVRWRTNLLANSRVRYGTTLASLDSNADELQLTTEHEVEVGGLYPDTKYYYSIGTTDSTVAGGDSAHFFVTSPVPGASKPTRIWILGDSGTKDANARSVRDAYYNFTGDRHTDFWLMLGDNAYDDGTDAEYQLAVFENMYEEMLRKSVLWPTLGNHDALASSIPGPYPYYDIFTLPAAGEAGGVASNTEEYYSFDYGNLHFICLNSEETPLRATNSAMSVWLQQDLAANDKEWTIVFWHHPPYTKGGTDSDTDPYLIEMRENFLPVLEAAGVDLVLAGHSHSYERSLLLDGHYGLSTTLTNDMILDSGDGRTDGNGAYQKATLGASPHEGAIYVVAGSSGGVAGGSLDHPVMVTSLNLKGSVVLDVDGNNMDVKFIDNAGNIGDYFSIVKGATLADFTGTPLTGAMPLTVSFTDQSIGQITSWSWDFGDGGMSTLQNPSYTYTTAGTYTVSLTVTGPDGSDSETKVDYITVTDGAPVTVSFQDGFDGYSGTRDTKLKDGNNAGTNFGTHANLEVDGNPDEAALLYWDVTSIPFGSTIQSVDITVNVTNISGDNYEIYDLKRAWIENEATWNVFASGQGWTVPGAGDSPDRGSTAFGAIVGSTLGSNTTSLNAAGVAVVQSWVDDPSSNHGFIVQDYINHTNGVDFSSREAATVADRPKLEVTYTNAGQPSLSISDTTSDEGAGTMTFLVSLSGVSGQSRQAVIMWRPQGRLRFQRTRLQERS